MNPELLQRIRAGSFVKVNFADESTVSGYVATDLSDPASLRLDGYWLAEAGCLQEFSLKIFPNEIAAIDFLPESPIFVDAEGQSLTMPRGFFKHLD